MRYYYPYKQLNFYGVNTILTQFIKTALKEKVADPEELRNLKSRFAKKYQVDFPSNSIILRKLRQLIKAKALPENSELISVLRIRKIRTLSGIASIGVHTKPLPCPGKCIYCPAEARMPKSYLSTQPAVIRSSTLRFDPYRMVRTRLKAYHQNGHATDKCELIVMGGTWSYHDPLYQIWFLKRCFDAFNDGLKEKNLTRKIKEPAVYRDSVKRKKIETRLWRALRAAQRKNEKASSRVVGLTLETRPDFVSTKEVVRMRNLGATRVEIGVQSIHNEILDLNKRGHQVAATVKATRLFKDAGFKITYHLMPGLYGSTPKKDFAMFRTIFSNSDFQPDQIKIYPTLVTKYSKLYAMWKNGQYRPYRDQALKNLLKQIKMLCPPYVRIARLFRDIPKQSIQGGMNITNIRQIIQQELNTAGKQCRCIRCREARGRIVKLNDARLVKREYSASGGKEIFISFESRDFSTIFAFCRLRLPQKSDAHFIPVLQNAAIIRELHTYGELMPIAKSNGKIQHSGFGKRLMAIAESIAQNKSYKKIAVISGIGVRPYYRKLGYKLKDEYMVRGL